MRRISNGLLGNPARRLGNGIAKSPAFLAATAVNCAPASSLVARRGYMPLPHQAQEDFSAYNEIDLPSESRIEAIRKSGIANDDWIAIEKVHGSNFGVYLLNEESVRYSKRSGIMDPNENFFGYHSLAQEFEAQIRIISDLLKQKFGMGFIGRVVMNGELFGCKYKHPLVKTSEKWCTMPNGKKFPMSGVLIQREPFPQYSPELHFFAFDLKYSVTGHPDDMVQLTFDDMQEIFSRVPNLLYQKPLIRGTLDKCLAFDIENFMTPLPALLGLGNYPLEHNLAEGIVIRHQQHGTPAMEAMKVSTIIKVRCSSFMELKHPNKQKELKDTFIDTVRAAAVRRSGEQSTIPEAMLPEVELAANNLLLNNVSSGRLSNVVSKVGMGPLLSGEATRETLTLALAKDSLKDFLKENNDPAVLNTPVAFRKILITNCYCEARKVVDASWEALLAQAKSEQEALGEAA